MTSFRGTGQKEGEDDLPVSAVVSNVHALYFEVLHPKFLSTLASESNLAGYSVICSCGIWDSQHSIHEIIMNQDSTDL